MSDRKEATFNTANINTAVDPKNGSYISKFYLVSSKDLKIN